MRLRSPSCWFVGLHLLGLLAVALVSAHVLGWLDLSRVVLRALWWHSPNYSDIIAVYGRPYAIGVPPCFSP